MSPLKYFLPTCFFLVFFLNTPFAKTPSINDRDIQVLLSEEKKELGLLKKKLQKHNKKLSSVKKKEITILETLSQMENRLKLRERELEIFKWNIEINKRKIGKLEKLFNKTEINIQHQKQALSTLLQDIKRQVSLHFSIRVRTIVLLPEASLQKTTSGKLQHNKNFQHFLQQKFQPLVIDKAEEDLQNLSSSKILNKYFIDINQETNT